MNSRYAVPGATGKEVVIFDLYPNTGASQSPFFLHSLTFVAHIDVLSYQYRCEAYHRGYGDALARQGDVQLDHGMSYRRHLQMTAVSQRLSWMRRSLRTSASSAGMACLSQP